MNPRHAGFMFRINMHWHHYCTMNVEGHPKGQGRPRAVNRGGHAGVYNPDVAKSWRERVFYGTNPHRPPKPFECPVRIDVKWRMPRPKRLMRKKDSKDEIQCDGAFDRDNLDKVILDAMADAGWYRNDKQVSAGYIEKVYHAKDGIPGAEIKVWTWR